MAVLCSVLISRVEQFCFPMLVELLSKQVHRHKLSHSAGDLDATVHIEDH